MKRISLASVLLALAGSLAPALAPTLAGAADCHPAINQQAPQYIIGYGSLMETESKERTAPNAGPNFPVRVAGYQRAWNTRGSLTGFSTTYLGVEINTGASMVATIYRVFAASDISATDEREAYYCRDAVKIDAIQMLDGSEPPSAGQVWIYVNKPDAIFPPDDRFPIVQSYVDIFIHGCLQLRTKVTSLNTDFAEDCVTTTKGWSKHWVNDRLYPRRPFIYQPNASKIDALLQKMVPDEFGAIQVE